MPLFAGISPTAPGVVRAAAAEMDGWEGLAAAVGALLASGVACFILIISFPAFFVLFCFFFFIISHRSTKKIIP
jgi:xanthine/uracil permease